MTPGIAKSRKVLFYLPYPEPDKVIINAHNFTPAFTGSVNGKSPAACWCPSRDTAGNGTTTLTDFAGSNNGTLTNFALTGSTSNWIADTTAGGVRALNFDGTNDVVLPSIVSAINGASAISISMWMKRNASSAFCGFYQVQGAGFGTGRTQLALWSDGNMYISLEASGTNAFGSFATNDTNWHHAVMVFNGALSGNSNRAKVFFDGTQKTLSFSGTIPALTNSSNNYECGIGPAFFGSRLHGASRVDDIRVFAQSLDSSDIAALYASGSGRGVSA